MLDKIREVICRYVSIDPEKLTEDTNIRSDLGLNSLELAELAVQCEEKFEIEIVDEDVHKFVTVRDIVDFLEQA